MPSSLVAHTSVSVLAPICRIDAERREVWGPLSTERVGTDGRVLDYDATVRALERWAGPEHNSGNMREMHERHKAVGVSVRWEADPVNRCVYLGSKVSRGAPDTWLKIEDGVLRYYSLKGPVWAEEDRLIIENGIARRVKWVTDYDIEETSYVDRGGDTGIAPLQILRSAQGWNSDLLDSAAIDLIPSNMDRPTGEIVRAAVTKSEDDGNHPSSDYAYVPDPEKPSTWKLRIDTAANVSAAAAALGPGFRGNKADIPDADRAKVKAKVRAAWKKAYPDKKEDEMPSGIQRAASYAISNLDISDKGTHGAATGKHTHEHSDQHGEMHTHDHTHDGNGDHGHSHADVERLAQQLTIFDQQINAMTDAMVEAYKMRRGVKALIKRQEDGETPPETELSQVQKAQQIISQIAELLASEVGELADDPDENNYGAQCLMGAIQELQAFCNDEAYETIARRREGEKLMATSDEIMATLKNVVERVGTLENRVTGATPVAQVNGAPAQTPVQPSPAQPAQQQPVSVPAPQPNTPTTPTTPVERSSTPEQGGTTGENAILEALRTVQGFVERVDQRISAIERTTPAQPGPILRTNSVPVEKMWPGGEVPTNPAEIEATFENIALNPNVDSSTRERAQLETVRRSVMNAANGASAKVIADRAAAFGTPQ